MSEEAVISPRGPSSEAPARYTPVSNKGLLTALVVLATLMQVLDSTIANVALLHIQSSLSATQDEIAWVLTSYIIASAVMFPLTGWLANRYGRRRVFLVSIALFITASALCGAATSLPQMVVFRLLQGMGGAALVPLSQAILLDINLPKDYGRAMAIWGVGVTLGPIMGPVIGGWLTDSYSWRWCFYINLPVGLLAFIGLYLTLPENRNLRSSRFDFTGFATLSIAVASLQLMLDRGQVQDWFSSREIVIEAVVSGLSFYFFLVHTFSTSKPFVDPVLFRNRNFLIGNLLTFLVTGTLFATLALHPLLLQGRLHYPVILSGLVIAPRGFGSIVGMVAAGRLMSRLDPRGIMAVGLGLMAYSLWQMTHYSLLMESWPVITAGIVQGLGIGLVNVCLTTIGFATLPSIYRNEGTAIANLIRSTGGAIGISVTVFLLTQNTQRMHSALGEHITPFNMTGNPAADAAHVDVLTTRGLMALDGLVTNQSAMVAYIDDFRLMMILTLLTIPFLLLFERPRS